MLASIVRRSESLVAFALVPTLSRQCAALAPSRVCYTTDAPNYQNFVDVFPEAVSPLQVVDPEVYKIIYDERQRQRCGLELIASENFTSLPVLEALGSCMVNKYSEGFPVDRCYGGTNPTDVEILCRERALKAFDLNPLQWGVNVQPYSGSPANFGVYTALLKPHDRIMGLDTASGGHSTHGYIVHGKRYSASSVYFETMSYKVDAESGCVNMDKIEEAALEFWPKLLVCGASAYPRDWDYKRFRDIADKVNALLMVDMSHISALVLAKALATPWEFADIVTTTTHKSLRGPKAGLIFYRKGPKPPKQTPMGDSKYESYDYEDKINAAIYPALQGGPHNHTITALAVAMKSASMPEFKNYAVQVQKNCAALAKALLKLGFKLMTGGTDNHLILWDVRPLGLSGHEVEKIGDLCCITMNKALIGGDPSPKHPGGVRIGTTAMTSRGLKEADYEKVAQLLQELAALAQKLSQSSGGDFHEFSRLAMTSPEVAQLRHKVETWAQAFPMPGRELAPMVA